ncbi:MAG: hypothetical protein KKD44_26345 [Proteobacteria bacterium]|nr:hypothetical protein [Pseudomonadota bacterium]
MPENIFREAKQLLATKTVLTMTENEVQTVKAATIPLNLLPQFNDMTTDEGLDYLARLFDEQYPPPRGESEKELQ